MPETVTITLTKPQYAAMMKAVSYYQRAHKPKVKVVADADPMIRPSRSGWVGEFGSTINAQYKPENAGIARYKTTWENLNA